MQRVLKLHTNKKEVMQMRTYGREKSTIDYCSDNIIRDRGAIKQIVKKEIDMDIMDTDFEVIDRVAGKLKVYDKIILGDHFTSL